METVTLNFIGKYDSFLSPLNQFPFYVTTSPYKIETLSLTIEFFLSPSTVIYCPDVKQLSSIIPNTIPETYFLHVHSKISLKKKNLFTRKCAFLSTQRPHFLLHYLSLTKQILQPALQAVALLLVLYYIFQLSVTVINFGLLFISNLKLILWPACCLLLGGIKPKGLKEEKELFWQCYYTLIAFTEIGGSGEMHVKHTCCSFKREIWSDCKNNKKD